MQELVRALRAGGAGPDMAPCADLGDQAGVRHVEALGIADQVRLVDVGADGDDTVAVLQARAQDGRSEVRETV